MTSTRQAHEEALARSQDESPTRSTTPEIRRPHMVMVVGNRVVGDSRVEKAATSAHKAGYDVTVLGLIHRSVRAFDTIDQIPVFRVSPPYAMHRWWRRHHDDKPLEIYSTAVDSRRRLRRLRSRTHPSARSNLARRVVSTIRRRSEDARLKLGRAAQQYRLAVTHLLVRLPIPGVWRRAFPYIADLELAFADAIVDLEPDIIHVHDRHILPGASTAARVLKASDRVVKWVYDAHEWLPGVEFKGPKVHAAAWLAAESELIHEADAVITVSDELADMLKQRHRLEETPKVVTNSPPRARSPVTLEGRVSVRDDCGLDSETDLLVCVGSIARVRGPETVLQALTMLPDVHLALIAPRDMKRRQEITELAMDVNVDDRLHILDYVMAQSVTSYISTGSVGLVPVEPIANYQHSLSTKVREYLHAGLPIVGSSLQTLTRFLEETGVGAVHRPGDPDDCARVIKEVLANRTAYVDSVTEELLDEHSWERQEAVLVEAWGNLMGERQPIPRTDSPRPRLVIGPVVDRTRSQNLLSAVCHEINGEGELIGRDSLVRPSARLAKKVEEYRRLVAESDGLILEGLQPLFGGLLADSEAQLRRLADVRSVAFMIDAVAGVDPDELVARIPDCWLLTLDCGARERISRQGHRTRQTLNKARVPVLATSPFPMSELSKVTWLPTVVDIVPRDSVYEGALRVLVAPGPRAGKDALVPERISKLASPRVEIYMPTPDDDIGDMLRNSDVLVDSLGHGSYTDLAAQAMGHGCVVLSRIDPQVRSVLAPTCPVIDSSPDVVADIVSDLASDRDRLVRLSEEATVYAREVHDGRRSAAVVLDALGWSG